MPAPPRISLDDADGVRLVRFHDRRLFDDATVREVGDQLFAALPRTGPIELIVDFSGVEMLSSAMIGKLILLLRRVDASGGKLRLCDLADPVRDVFQSTHLDRLFPIARDRREAREAFGPARGAS